MTEARVVVSLALGGLLFLLLVHPPGDPILSLLAGTALVAASFAAAASAILGKGRRAEVLLVGSLSAILFHDVFGTAADVAGGVGTRAWLGLLALRVLLALGAFVAVGRARPFSPAPP
jgi:hypothetical protein